MIKIRIKRINSLAKLPARATAGSAGCDLCAATAEKLLIRAGETAKVPTGISVEIPSSDLVGLVFARSGLSVKAGVSLANAVGVIDSDYRGEIVVALHNHSPNDYFVGPGERIAQLLIMPVVVFEFEEADELGDTQRGDGGFGSTGTK
ncbi:deoxyuridine 5'-triphosphate nucleotidohydrolase [Clostridia bacterium]|nr:deoxyuridine 5'-triphosphate nucleotidohydrolase [Clostridia bacterium]